MAAPKTAVAVKKSTGVVTYQDRLAAMAKESTDQEASVSTGAFISFKAGQLSYQGSPVKGNELDVIVVDSVLENCYYDGDYDPDAPMGPVCYAFGRDDSEMRPHEKSSAPQHATCKGCPHNEFGSAEKGKGKACKNTRRLAVLPAHPLTEEALKKAECAFMKLPVTSVKGWAGYVRTLSTLEKLPPLAVVTTVSTVPDPKTQFKVVFQKAGNVDEKLMPALFQRHDAMVEEIMFPYQEATEKPAKKTVGKPKARKY